MILLINGNQTTFMSYDKIRQRVSKVHEIRQVSEQSTENIPTIRATTGGKVTGREIIRKINDSQVTVLDFLYHYYSYTDQLERIQWVIQNQEKIEQGYRLKKATGKFRGRTWTAWFSEDIPAASGPWLLGGLPGLILHAYDEGKEIEFKVTALEDERIIDDLLVENEKVLRETNTLDRRITQVSKKQYFTQRKTMLKDPTAFTRSMYTQATGIQDYGILNRRSWTEVAENPIDKNEVTY